MDSNDKTFKMRYAATLLFIVSAVCFYFAALGWGGLGLGFGTLVSLAVGVNRIQLGLLILFAVFLFVCLLRKKEDGAPRLAKLFFLVDVCVAGLCFLLHLIITVIAAVDGGLVATPIVAVCGSLLRLAASAVLLFTFMGVIPSKFTAAVITGVAAFLSFVLFVLILALPELGRGFSYEFFGIAVFLGAFALYLFALDKAASEQPEQDSQQQEQGSQQQEPAGKPAPKKAKAAKAEQAENTSEK